MCLATLFKPKTGFATIVLPVIYPSTVGINTPFDIVYTVKNTGKVADKLWAHLVCDGAELFNSKWVKNVPVNGTVKTTYHHSGIAKDSIIKIEAGYQ